MKLSKTQQELYDAMKAGVIVHYMPYMGRFNPTEYYFRSDNSKRVTSAANALKEKGLAETVGKYNDKKLVLIEGTK
jgi:hypothetical protein